MSMEYKIGVIIGMAAAIAALKLLEPAQKERGGDRRDNAGHDAYEHVEKPFEAEAHGGLVERHAALSREARENGETNNAVLSGDGVALGPCQVDGLGGEKRLGTLELDGEGRAGEFAEK